MVLITVYYYYYYWLHQEIIIIIRNCALRIFTPTTIGLYRQGDAVCIPLVVESIWSAERGWVCIMQTQPLSALQIVGIVLANFGITTCWPTCVSHLIQCIWVKRKDCCWIKSSWLAHCPVAHQDVCRLAMWNFSPRPVTYLKLTTQPSPMAKLGKYIPQAVVVSLPPLQVTAWCPRGSSIYYLWTHRVNLNNPFWWFMPNKQLNHVEPTYRSLDHPY